MSQSIQMMGLYVRDQDEALAFYVDKLGFRVSADVRNGDYRWLTVQHPDQPSFQLGLFVPGPPVHDAATAQDVEGKGGSNGAKGEPAALGLSVRPLAPAEKREVDTQGSLAKASRHNHTIDFA